MIVGAVLIAIALVLVLPALIWASIWVVSFLASEVLPRHADETHEGSELIATNV